MKKTEESRQRKRKESRKIFQKITTTTTTTRKREKKKRKKPTGNSEIRLADKFDGVAEIIYSVTAPFAAVSNWHQLGT